METRKSTKETKQSDNFFDLYFDYVGDTEAPKFYHRWCALSCLGGLLGRQMYFKQGHFQINCNMYVMLIGAPAARKSVSIKLMKKLMQEFGYEYFSADKTTKEKFLLDLHEQAEGDDYGILEENIFANTVDAKLHLTAPPAQMFIAGDEFNDFIGHGNMEFLSLLGNFWDYQGTFINKIKNGKSCAIPNPTISILGGNTQAGFNLAFPVEILGQGFFSRLLLIYGESTGKKITFLEEPDQEAKSKILAYMGEIQRTCTGVVTMTTEARSMIDKIYKTWDGMEDIRFESYAGRRLTHMIKLCMLYAASRISTEITAKDVVAANTILTHTEHMMPKALGEFGKGRNSDVAAKILSILEKATLPVPARELLTAIHSDVDNLQVAVNILKDMTIADKIMLIGGEHGGYLRKMRIRHELDTELIDMSILSDEEQSY